MKISLFTLMSLASLGGSAMAQTMDAPDYAPEEIKEKRINFYFQGARLYENGALPPEQGKETGITLRFVKFNYGNKSTGKNGGEMHYMQIAPNMAELKADSYHGSGYQIKVHPDGEKSVGTWTLIFGDEASGSARYEGTEFGKPIRYEDVYFTITDINAPENAKAPEYISCAHFGERQKGGPNQAPQSVAGMVIKLHPSEAQRKALEGNFWVRFQMQFGRDYSYEGTNCNHMVASRNSENEEWTQGQWVNSFRGETELVMYPGYFDYVADKEAPSTASITLAGESSDSAKYTLTFTSATAGKAEFIYETQEDLPNGEMKVNRFTLGDIPFTLEKP